VKILVTNDDGVTAPGLLALAQALRKLDAEITVLAPDHNWSASGHVKTMHRPLRLSGTTLADGSQAWKSDGAPSDCVALAMMGALESDFDLVVSGINPNANIGLDVTYSGTVDLGEAGLCHLAGRAGISRRTAGLSFRGGDSRASGLAAAARGERQAARADFQHQHPLPP